MYAIFVRVTVYVTCLLMVPDIIWKLAELNAWNTAVSMFTACYLIYVGYQWARGDLESRLWFALFLVLKGSMMLYPAVQIYAFMQPVGEGPVAGLLASLTIPFLVIGSVLLGLGLSVFLTRSAHENYAYSKGLERTLRARRSTDDAQQQAHDTPPGGAEGR